MSTKQATSVDVIVVVVCLCGFFFIAGEMLGEYTTADRIATTCTPQVGEKRLLATIQSAKPGSEVTCIFEYAPKAATVVRRKASKT